MATLYNHKNLETEDKPLIKNIQFKQLLNRIRNGDTEAYNKAHEYFSFEYFQKQFLKREYENQLKNHGNNTINNNEHNQSI